MKRSILLLILLSFFLPKAADAERYILKVIDNANAYITPDPNRVPDPDVDTLLEDDNFEPSSGQGLDIGFDFPFYCQTYRQVYINANGFIALEAKPNGSGWDDTDNYPFPLLDCQAPCSNQEFYGIPLIAPFWSDVSTEHNTNPDVLQKNGQVWYRIDTVSSPKRFIVTWNDVYHWYGNCSYCTPPGVYGSPHTAGGNSFQLILYEDGRIEFNYGAMGWKGTDAPYRQAATIGIYSGDQVGTSCDNLSTPELELYPADDTVAAATLQYLFDSDDDDVADDGDASGVAGDNPCPTLTDPPSHPYYQPYPISCDDNCANSLNLYQDDFEGDGLGDVCDLDDDNDGTPDTSDPFPFDTDNDGIDNDLDPDDDNDGLSDLDEINLYLGFYDPLKADTDGNGTSDGQEDFDGDAIVNVNDPLPLDQNFADGDLDASGVVDIADALIAMRIASGLVNATSTHLQHGDVAPSGVLDGVVDISDALVVMKMAAGLP
jgi:hypothetical protein